MHKQVLFIIHGKKRAAQMIAGQLKRLEPVSFTFSFYTTSREKDANVFKDYKTGFDLIVAVGGDGLINEVLNKMISEYSETGLPLPALGFIPAGSGNDLARSFPGNRTITAFVASLHRFELLECDYGVVRYSDGSHHYL